MNGYVRSLAISSRLGNRPGMARQLRAPWARARASGAARTSPRATNSGGACLPIGRRRSAAAGGFLLGGWRWIGQPRERVPRVQGLARSDTGHDEQRRDGEREIARDGEHAAYQADGQGGKQGGRQCGGNGASHAEAPEPAACATAGAARLPEDGGSHGKPAVIMRSSSRELPFR